MDNPTTTTESHEQPQQAPTPTPTPPRPAAPGMVFTPEQIDRVKARLTERGAVGPCPRCGNPEFTIVGNGILKPALQDFTDSQSLGGPTVPSLITVCIRCGFLSLYALGTLGFLKGGKVEI
jgi:hypothetical protein